MTELTKEGYPIYGVQCDDHAAKGYRGYCQVCMLRTEMREMIDKTKKSMSHMGAQVQICINDFRDELKSACLSISHVAEHVIELESKVEQIMPVTNT